MTKHEFFKELKFALRFAEYQDVEEILEYYDELIMERRERGESEDDIVASFDPIDVIAANFSKELDRKERKQKISKAQIMAVADPGPKNFSRATAAAFTLPIKIPAAIVLGILLFAVSVLTFALVTALWATVGGLIIGGIGELVSGVIVMIAAQSPLMGFVIITIGLLAAAIGFFLIAPAKAVTKGMFKLAALIVKGIVALFGGGQKKEIKNDGEVKEYEEND